MSKYHRYWMMPALLFNLTTPTACRKMQPSATKTVLSAARVQNYVGYLSAQRYGQTTYEPVGTGALVANTFIAKNSLFSGKNNIHSYKVSLQPDGDGPEFYSEAVYGVVAEGSIFEFAYLRGASLAKLSQESAKLATSGVDAGASVTLMTIDSDHPWTAEVSAIGNDQKKNLISVDVKSDEALAGLFRSGRAEDMMLFNSNQELVGFLSDSADDAEGTYHLHFSNDWNLGHGTFLKGAVTAFDAGGYGPNGKALPSPKIDTTQEKRATFGVKSVSYIPSDSGWSIMQWETFVGNATDFSINVVRNDFNNRVDLWSNRGNGVTVELAPGTVFTSSNPGDYIMLSKWGENIAGMLALLSLPNGDLRPENADAPQVLQAKLQETLSLLQPAIDHATAVVAASSGAGAASDTASDTADSAGEGQSADAGSAKDATKGAAGRR